MISEKSPIRPWMRNLGKNTASYHLSAREELIPVLDHLDDGSNDCLGLLTSERLSDARSRLYQRRFLRSKTLSAHKGTAPSNLDSFNRLIRMFSIRFSLFPDCISTAKENQGLFISFHGQTSDHAWSFRNSSSNASARKKRQRKEKGEKKKK